MFYIFFYDLYNKMMPIEKWLKLLLLIILFVVIIKLISMYGGSSVTPSPSASPSSSPSVSQSQCNDNKCITKNGNANVKCGSVGEGCKSCDSLLPVLDPRFNMREICKQSVLLEDHLFQKEKRCHDCIIKHFLTIEGLAEEAVTLDKEHKYNELIDLILLFLHLNF
jgi:hypothetical protein